MATSTGFKLPKDGAIYTESVFKRCRDLVRYDVWSGIELSRLDGWITNFETPEERYFAARVIDTLIYRSKQQTLALMKQLFQRVIPDLARRQGLNKCLCSVYQSLKNRNIDPCVRIVPVIPPNHPPTKSGPTIARMLKRQLRFCEEWIVHPKDVSGEDGQIDSIVFVDDFLGTGEQFSEFLSDTGLEPLLSAGCCIYAPLAAHTEGVNYLRTLYDDLHVEAVELLDKTHALFHEESGSFPDGVNSTEDAREFYYKLLEDRKIEIGGPNRRGFGHFELTYVFEHAVPDNSLPILWWCDSGDWRPLFDR